MSAPTGQPHDNCTVRDGETSGVLWVSVPERRPAHDFIPAREQPCLAVRIRQSRPKLHPGAEGRSETRAQGPVVDL